MQTPLLVVKDLVKHFPVKGGVFGRETATVRAVEGISFSVGRGQTLSLVGESGSGKTTAGRCVLRLHEPTSGSVQFDGIELTALSSAEMRAMRKRMQLVFQDPFGSLNPRITVYNVLAEAMAVHRICPSDERRDRVHRLLSLVGLPPEAADRYPHEFSGGQRQRIGIARALAVEPDLIVADEPVSALDVSIQAQILNLMEELQERFGLSYLFIGHNLGVVRHISDTVAVMYLGHIVEMAPAETLFEAHQHPYTRALLSAVPEPTPRRARQRILLSGDVPSPINPPAGCPFHPRCPDARPECSQRGAPLIEFRPGHWVACPIHAPDNSKSAPGQQAVVT